MRYAMAALLCLLLCTPACALEWETQADAYGTAAVEQALPESAREILGDVTAADCLDSEGLLAVLGQAARKTLLENLRESAGQAASLVCVVLLTGLGMAAGPESAGPCIRLGGTAAIAAVAAGQLSGFLGSGMAAVETLSDFSRALLPTLTAAATAAGAATSAGVRYAASALFMDILLTAGRRVVLPLNWAFVALSTADSAFGGGALAPAAKLMRWLCTTLLTLTVLAFTAYLGFTGLISGTVDASALRLTRTAISTALPLVGGILTDAASSVMAGAAMVRSALGVLGLLAAAAICLGPFLALGVRYLLYKAAAAVSSALGGGGLAGYIGAIGNAFAVEMALVGAGGAMLFISVAFCVKAVGAA